jgi:Fic family protein
MASINSYCSNLIEGNNTRPHEIRQAQVGDFSSDPVKRDLQLELIAHIHVQNWIAEQDVSLEILYTPEFIQAVLQQFYEHIPPALHQIKNEAGNKVHVVVPCAWRDHEVKVGQHIALAHSYLPALMGSVCQNYNLSKYTGDRKIIAIMCAHNRLAWVHPFSDVNGRVSVCSLTQH